MESEIKDSRRDAEAQRAQSEKIADIAAQMRLVAYLQTADPPQSVLNLADRIETAHKREVEKLNSVIQAQQSAFDAEQERQRREANSIERLVRDVIIDYQEMYVHAPNDDAERELVERAERGNAWLVAHGYEPEPVNFGKEEIPCL